MDPLVAGVPSWVIFAPPHGIKENRSQHGFHTTHFHFEQFRFSRWHPGVCGSVVGWDAMLQDRRSWFRFPIRSLDFFNCPNSSSRTMVLGPTQPLKEMSTRNLPGA
jgi:hypothetical protein